ncbi:MAG: hypothetical protein H6807_04885 [Planctomycetes bacterium]|nr:hypothetical protein [Planctomycetota bacterium]
MTTNAGKARPCPGLLALSILGLALSAAAQVSRFPDGGDQGSLTEIMSGIGAGSARRPYAPSGVVVEPESASAPLAEAGALRAELGYLRWERWWHESLYEILRSDRKRPAAPDSLVLRDALDLLRRSLAGGSLQERRAAALALARSGAEGIVGDLVFALPDAEEELRPAIVLALGLSGSEEARPYLDALVRDDRFGRGTLGARRQPVPRELRCVAALAIGLLPPRAHCTVIHDILSAPADYDADLYLAAALGLGLQGAAVPEAGREHEGRFGTMGSAINPCARRLPRYLELIDDDSIDQRARGALLDAVLAAAPREFGVLDKALDFLASDKVILARSAAMALQRVGPEGRARALEGLWSRVNDRSDATAAGLALVSIGRIADDEAFRKLVESQNLNPALLPYQAFALAEAARNSPLRGAAALLRLRVMLDRALEDEQSGMGAIMLALGLLRDDGSLDRMAEIAAHNDAETLRAAATLSISLAGGKVTGTELAEKMVQKNGRENVFLVHHGALALAVSNGKDSIDRLTTILESRRDEYSLGGVARAIGLIGDPAAIPGLMKIAGNPEESSEARAFAIGSIGLLLERRDFPMSRLRAIAPLPLASAVLREALSYL